MDMATTAFSGAAEQARMLAAGRATSPELLDIYLERIGRLDPQLNAYRTVRAEKARREATDAQRRIDAGERLPLLGVAVAIKDDVDVAGELTAWGTSAHGPIKEHDAEVVRRLRAAGAIVIGKTNVPEMTIWPFTESPTFGATRNPWDPSRSPGGSSGGTAAAVAAGLAAFGVGSDGGGSIRTPAAWCGLFGLKPQRDRVPLSPHDDAWQGLSVNGPITRTVEDAALFLDVTTTAPAPDGGFVAAASRTPTRLRIAISTNSPIGILGRVGEAQKAAVSEAAALLRGLGHDVVERAPDYGTLSAGGHIAARYLRGIHDDVATMAHPERLERRTRSMAWAGGRISNRRIAAARSAEARLAARHQRHLRRRRRRHHARHRGRPSPGRLAHGTRSIDHHDGDDGKVTVSGHLQRDRATGCGRPLGPRRHSHSDSDPAGRTTVRRGHTPRAQHPDRIGAALGQPTVPGVLSRSRSARLQDRVRDVES